MNLHPYHARKDSMIRIRYVQTTIYIIPLFATLI